MNKKTKPISVRLSSNELSILKTNSTNLNMTDSEYIRSLINNTLPAANDHAQEIAAALCRVYILLQEKGLEDALVTKEVQRLCQILS